MLSKVSQVVIICVSCRQSGQFFFVTQCKKVWSSNEREATVARCEREHALTYGTQLTVRRDVIGGIAGRDFRPFGSVGTRWCASGQLVRLVYDLVFHFVGVTAVNAVDD